MSKTTTEFDPQPEDFDDQLFQEAHDEGALEDPLPVAGYKSVCYCWRLICPPDNWREPIPLDVAELRLLEILTQRLDLVLTRDDKRKKLYLGPADGKLGLADGEQGDSDGANGSDRELDPGLPSAGPGRSGLRFSSGWTADVFPEEEAGEEYEAIDREAAAPLISAFPDAQLSKNYRLSEFRPSDHNYDLIRISPRLVNILEEIRTRAGDYPLHITSGYRPPTYNRKVGGVSNSTHIDGLAADIYSDYMGVEELYDICDRVIGDRGGVGYYPTQGFIHVDLRGYRARW